MRNAIRGNSVITFAVVLAAIWTVLTALRVWDQMVWTWDYVGQTATSGLIGLLVIGGLFGLMLVLYGELEADTVGPQPFEE